MKSLEFIEDNESRSFKVAQSVVLIESTMNLTIVISLVDRLNNFWQNLVGIERILMTEKAEIESQEGEGI